MVTLLLAVVAWLSDPTQNLAARADSTTDCGQFQVEAKCFKKPLFFHGIANRKPIFGDFLIVGLTVKNADDKRTANYIGMGVERETQQLPTINDDRVNDVPIADLGPGRIAGQIGEIKSVKPGQTIEDMLIVRTPDRSAAFLVINFPGPTFSQTEPQQIVVRIPKGNQTVFRTSPARETAVRPKPERIPEPPSTAITGFGPTPNYSRGSGGSVHVKGYFRKDGTYVKPHTRHSPK